ncbi:trypsin-like peptidase domain-containing protein [Desulfatiferula olefinivorans]
MIGLTLMQAGPVNADISARRSKVVEAVEKISPSVVNISSEYDVYDQTNPFFTFRRDQRFHDFFNDFFEPRFRNKTKRMALGSGVIIDGKRGYILTNAHVIEKTGSITVTLNDDREFNAQLVGADPDSDLAVLQITTDEALPSVNMGNSHDLMIGETVIAIGNPFGFSNTVSTGVISATDRSIKSGDRVYRHFIQIDAPINPGNSGGPLLNILGELIGINTAIYADAQGIGFAIPIDRARRIIDNLITYGRVIQAWTGLIVQNMDPDISDYLGIDHQKGVVIKDLFPESPGIEAGFKKWDVIVAIDGEAVQHTDMFDQIIRRHSAGDRLKVRINRSGTIRDLVLPTRPFPVERADQLAMDLLGVRVVSKTGRKGVMISELSRQAGLFSIGVRPGDWIRRINDIPIDTKEDFNKALITYRSNPSLVLLITRNDRGYYITLELQG